MIHGIHHITAVASDPQGLVTFVRDTLGLRLVKRSINQDQVEAYHLFFGDTLGEPGMDLTYFTFTPVHRSSGRVGAVTQVQLMVPEASLGSWVGRLGAYVEREEEQFGTKRVVFADGDGGRYALVGVSESEYVAAVDKPWTQVVGADMAIGAFYGARLSVEAGGSIEPVLEQMLGYVLVDEVGGVKQYVLDGVARAARLEVEVLPNAEPVWGGAGSVHHIAFGVADEDALVNFRDRVMAVGLRPTEVIDRHYFKSVYFRTSAGILFELATMGPGFTVDEDEAHLGERLSIPPFLESRREYIESVLPELE